ncbi:MAG: ATP-binding protein [Polyangiaceae bacterium]
MSEEHAPPLVILCRQGERFAWLVTLAARRFPGIENPVQVEPCEDDVRESVRRARSAHGGSPLGIVVVDEPAALLAVEAGADEAVPEERLDAESAFGFIDRILLRARLRREQEQVRALYVHSEKLAALGTLVAGVAHEVNNPLTSLLLSAEGLKLRVNPLHAALGQVDDLARAKRGASAEELQEVLRIGRTGAPLAETRELLQEIESSAKTIAGVVRDLKLFSRPDDDASPEVVDLRTLMDQVLRIVGRQIRQHGTLELDYAADLPVLVAPSARLAQVFTNVLLNACHAISEVTRPTHRIRISARADDEAVAVCISDTGPGIPPHVLGRIFNPFFTTKRQGVGTGLGLCISRSILRRLGGDLLVESVHGDGATFIALIPLPDRRELFEAYRRTTKLSAPQARPHADKRVLVVDADERVLRAFARTLDNLHDVLLAHDGQEAIDLLESGSRADVIVADVSMPDESGIVLYGWLNQRRPELACRVIFVTEEDQERPSAMLDSSQPVLKKPVSRDALLSAVSVILSEPERLPAHDR